MMRCRTVGAVACLILAACAAGEEAEKAEKTVVDLTAENFDSVVGEKENVFVHFFAPWSKKCSNLIPTFEELLSESFNSEVVIGKSDISAPVQTSFLAKHGVTRLPTIVFFRNGHILEYKGGYAAKEMSDFITMTLTNPPPPRDMKDAAASETMRAQQEEQEEQRRVVEEELARKKLEDDAKKKREEDEEATKKRRELAAAAGLSEEVPLEESPCGSMSPVRNVNDDLFESVVLDKNVDVLVEFFAPSDNYCKVNGTAYDEFSKMLAKATSQVVTTRMSTKENKTPFVFEDNELPVLMLFNADDKRPMEFDEGHDVDALMNFVRKHASSGSSLPDTTKDEL